MLLLPGSLFSQIQLPHCALAQLMWSECQCVICSSHLSHPTLWQPPICLKRLSHQLWNCTVQVRLPLVVLPYLTVPYLSVVVLLLVLPKLSVVCGWYCLNHQSVSVRMSKARCDSAGSANMAVQANKLIRAGGGGTNMAIVSPMIEVLTALAN